MRPHRQEWICFPISSLAGQGHAEQGTAGTERDPGGPHQWPGHSATSVAPCCLSLVLMPACRAGAGYYNGLERQRSDRLVGGVLKASHTAWGYFLALSPLVTTSMVTGRATFSLMCPRAKVETVQTHRITVLPQDSSHSIKPSHAAAATVLAFSSLHKCHPPTQLPGSLHPNSTEHTRPLTHFRNQGLFHTGALALPNHPYRLLHRLLPSGPLSPLNLYSC